MWYYTPSPRMLAWITKVHRALYRATSGVLGASLPQVEETSKGKRLRVLTVVLLTTKGRKSGALRTVPLPCFVYEGRTFVVGSFAGSEQHPAWFHNVTVEPDVEVQLRSRRLRCRAVTLTGAERARFWTKLTEDWPRYRIYEIGTRREIPLVELVGA